MSQRLSDVVIPHLQYENPHDNKGILIVGNYGTGKSHLLSLLSAVAENADLLPLLTNPTVQKAASETAGKFKVIRLEIGSTQMAFQEIITTALEKNLADWGVSFRFPDATQQYENKTSFENMMDAFHKKFPNHGLLMVVDELLDYLRSRHDQPLILDLGFLRELGEVCKDLRFRFLAGVQEAIFDSGRFAHVASSLGRVKDRFQQVRIASTDVKYVVANRLLKKSPNQLARVREYLEPFAKFYTNMNERMDDFAELFPIHPEYIETFERIPIVEKRGVLQIISDTIKKLVDQQVPVDRPGIEAFDSYWKALIENPANKAIPEVAAIIECSDVLTAKIKNAYTKPPYRWKERQAPRLGYLFFGTPGERSTAIPPRDFYFYFIQPFDPPRFTDDKLPDEIFFRLSEKDKSFDDSLKFYSAALELAGTSSGAKKELYLKKATDHLAVLSKWMRDHLLANMDASYQGQKKKLLRWLQARPGAGPLNIRDAVNAVGSACLAEHFANQAPNYPTFSILLTTRNIPQAAQDAIRGIAQPATRTKQATAILDALELLDGDKLDPARSPFAKHIMDMLKAKGQGQVLNRQELIQAMSGLEYFVPEKFRLDDLRSALFPDGSPTTPAELKGRFEQFVSGLLKGKDAGRTRIVLE
jgi:hypothetical protein